MHCTVHKNGGLEVWRCKLASGGSGMFRTWRVPGVLEVKVSEVREVTKASSSELS